MSEDDELKAKSIVEGWYWQLADGHNYRFAHAVKSMTLFYESAPLEADVLKLVTDWLKTRQGVTELVVGHKKLTWDSGWTTKDAWYQTAASEKWSGTESSKVRLYWVLVQGGDASGDPGYLVENGCKTKVTHDFYWDVAELPSLPASSSGVQWTMQGLTRDREAGTLTLVGRAADAEALSRLTLCLGGRGVPVLDGTVSEGAVSVRLAPERLESALRLAHTLFFS